MGISPAEVVDMVLAMVVQLWLAQAGCSKDTDCKGDRICEAGVCVSPKPAALVPAPAPPPPPPVVEPEGGWPRVVRRDGLVCVQAPGADGRIEESCRKDGPAPRLPRRGGVAMDAPSAPPPVEQPEPGGRFVADVLAQGGFVVLSAGGLAFTLPQLNAYLALGARFRGGVGVVATGALLGGFLGGGSMFVGSFAPGVRFGDHSHFTLSAGPSFLGYRFGTGSGSGLMFSVLMQGVFAVNRVFGFSVNGALHADTSGVMFVLGAGLGFGAF